MSDKPKYILEVVEFSPRTTDPWPAMDGAVATLKARGYDPVFATPISDVDGGAEALLVVGKVACDPPHDRP